MTGVSTKSEQRFSTTTPMLPSDSGTVLTVKDLEIVRAEQTKDEFNLNKSLRCFSWTVLIVLLLAQISNQWQRFMIGSTYAYEYTGDEDPKKYEIKTDIPNFT